MTPDRLTPDELDELLGSYAVGALDDDELDAVERALEADPVARREAHRLEAAMLEFSEAEATAVELPTGSWDRLFNRIAGDRDTERTTEIPAGLAPPAVPLPPVVSLVGRRRSPRYFAPAMAAAAVLIVAGLAVARPWSGTTAGSAARTALADPSSRIGTLAGAQGTVRVVLTRDGHGYIIGKDLPALTSAQTYQMWSLDSGSPTSLGVVGPKLDAAKFTSATVVHKLALTVEPKGGSAAPTSAPVAVGDVA